MYFLQLIFKSSSWELTVQIKLKMELELQSQVMRRSLFYIQFILSTPSCHRLTAIVNHCLRLSTSEYLPPIYICASFKLIADQIVLVSNFVAPILPVWRVRANHGRQLRLPLVTIVKQLLCSKVLAKMISNHILPRIIVPLSISHLPLL